MSTCKRYTDAELEQLLCEGIRATQNELVASLALAREYVSSTLEEKKQALEGYPLRWKSIQDDLTKIDAVLAAYRSGGKL